MSWLWIGAIVALLVAAVAVVIVVLLRRARRPKPRSDGRVDVRAEVRSSLDSAWRGLVAKMPGPLEREKLARVLVLGDSGSGKTSLIAAAGLRSPLGSTPKANAPVRVDLVGSALYIEVAGKVLETHEEEDDEQDAFVELCRGLRAANPSRPADVIVLAVACDALQAGGPAGAEEIKKLATSVRLRFAQIEQELSVLPPVYVVVTGSDSVHGFLAFVQALPESLRHSILGWSSPHGPLATSVTDWTGEAMRSIKDDIAEAQEQRFLSDAPIKYPESYYMFGSELATIERPLTSYIDEIFFPAPGGEPFVLRGIYFTGALTEAPPPPPPAQAGAPEPPPPDRPVAFARELFEKKILPEIGLVRPSARAKASRKRAILALQIAAACAMVIGSILLWIESARLDRHTASLRPLLDGVATSLLEAKSPEADPTGAQTGHSIAFFKGLNGVGTDRLRSVLLPLSWPSAVDDRVESAVAAAYQRVVLDAYASQLPPRVIPLELDTPSRFGPVGGDTALEKTPEFLRFEAWLRDLTIFETNVARYDRLIPGIEPETPEADARVQDVAGIAAYLWGYKIEPGHHAKYYRYAISRPAWRTALLIEPHRTPVQERAERLFTALSDRQLDLHHEGMLRFDVDAIKQGLAELDAGGADMTPEKLWVLRDAIGRVEARLSAPALGWITAEGPPASAALERLLEQVRNSRLLGPDLELKLRGLGVSRLLLLKGDLLSAEAPLCGPILKRTDGIVQPQLSPCILALKGPLDALRGQGFMTITANGTLQNDGDDGRLVWDVEVLKEAAAIPKQLEGFLQEGGLKGADPRIVEPLKGVAARAVRTNVVGRVVKAARREASLPDTRAEVTNFTQASVPLRDVLSAFGRLHLDDSRDRLRSLVRAQGARVLGQAYGELSRAGLYAIEGGTFAWWDGEGTPIYRAFGVDDLGQLTEYAAAQRSRAESYAKELAEPAMAALESPEVGADDKSTPQITSWRRVVTPLKDYEAKKAGNTVSGLERLLLTELPNVTLDNCLSELEKGSHRRERDYFADRRGDIREKLHARCLQLSADDIRLRYSSVRRSFNRDIAGRFPFAKLKGAGTTAVDDAPVDAVRRILASATDVRKRYRSALLGRGDPSATAVVRFLDKMEAVRVFLAPVLAQGESNVDGSYDTRVEFRVNQAREVGGHQIAEWALRVSDERLTLGGPKSTVRWRLEDPVKFNLRWAKNSPDIPTPKQDEEERWSVGGRETRTEEQGLWALLRLISRHQVVLREEEGGDAGGHTLMFSVRTIPDPEGGFLDRVGGDSAIVRVYIRLFLVGTEKDKLLKYPDFPTTAPALSGSEEGDKG